MSKQSAQEEAIRQTVKKLLSTNGITDANLHNLDLSVIGEVAKSKSVEVGKSGST